MELEERMKTRFPVRKREGGEQMLVWQTAPTEVNGYEQILQRLGADDSLVSSFDGLAKAMVRYATTLANSSTAMKGQLLGAKLQMSCDSRETEVVVTRPRTDVGLDELRNLHDKHQTHLFRILIPLDDLGVWQILFPKLLMSDKTKLDDQENWPRKQCESQMLFVNKMSYAIIPADIIFSENLRTSIMGNKHLEMYLMLSPQDREYPPLIEKPEYYCLGNMNLSAHSGGMDDRGMVVYPYHSIAGRDCHLATSLALEKVTQTMCLVQGIVEEKTGDRKSRLEKWGFEVVTTNRTSQEENADDANGVVMDQSTLLHQRPDL